MKPRTKWWQGHAHSWARRPARSDEIPRDVIITQLGDGVIEWTVRECRCGQTGKAYLAVASRMRMPMSLDNITAEAIVMGLARRR